MVNYPPLSDLDKPLLDLGGVALGVLILYPSGVVYSTQTGGTACLHPWAEGVILPIYDPEERQQTQLRDHFVGPKWGGCGATSGIDAEDAEFIDRVLGASRETEFLSVDPDLLSQSHEAWVHVTIGAHPDRFPELPLHSGDPRFKDLMSPIFGFGAAKGILTWPNSD